jgi:signal transduction histidine kinase
MARLFSRPSVRLQPILLGVGFALLVVISVAIVLLVDRAADDAGKLVDALKVENQLSDLLLNVRRAESSQRGYLITGNSDYLDELHEAEPQAKDLLDSLRDLTKEDARRRTTIDRAAELIKAKFQEMERVAALYSAGQHDAAHAGVGGGAQIMDSLRELIEGAIEQESRLASERTGQSHRTNSLLLAVTLIGAALIVLVGGVSITLMQRNVRQVETARTELAGINANLERIVAYRTADLTEANEEIQRFAYIVSHDLRSPLVNIMGFTAELEALRKDIFARIETLENEVAALAKGRTKPADSGDEQLGLDFDEAIGFIKSSIANMDRLISAVLKLSREGRRQFNPQTIDMNALLQSIAANVAHRSAEMSANFDIDDLPPAESDRLALEQIFTNLVDNALKYGRSEEPLRIDVTGRETATHVIYDVKDNGRGIDPRDHQRVFELFRRSGTLDRPGEGIGLAHVRALVRRLGGTLGLSSELGKGSIFTVTLPRKWSVESRSAA